MKFWILIACAVLVGCSNELTANKKTEASSPGVAETGTAGMPMKPDAAQEPSMSTEVVIDVRSKEEWDTGHVEQAVHIPHTEIAQRIAEATEDKTAKIVVYCAVGGRAGKAKETLEKLGFTNVENAGGYDDIKSRYANP